MIDADLIGEANLARKLAQAGKRAEARVRKRAQELGKRIATEMRDRVPVRSGATRDSIRVEDDPDGNGVIVKAGGTPETTKPTASGGHSFDVALMTEFGTQHSPAQPFFFPVANEYRREIEKQMGEAATSSIEEDLE